MKQTETFLDALQTGDYDKAKTELSSALENLTTNYMKEIITKENA
jgi:ribosomal protein S20